MKKISIAILSPLILFASGEANPIFIYSIFVGGFIVVILFFWGIHKAIKTQQTKYTWAMLPFFILMGLMFIR